MGETKDLARLRLTHFLAARLKARQREVNEAQRANPGVGSTILPHSAENPARITEDSGLRSRETPRSEHYPITSFGSPN
jgi:hypothetical protein